MKTHGIAVLMVWFATTAWSYTNTLQLSDGITITGWIERVTPPMFKVSRGAETHYVPFEDLARSEQSKYGLEIITRDGESRWVIDPRVTTAAVVGHNVHGERVTYPIEDIQPIPVDSRLRFHSDTFEDYYEAPHMGFDSPEEQVGEIFADAIERHPKAGIVVVTGLTKVNEHVTDHLKYIWDRQRNLLVQLRRSEFRFGPEHYSWVLWENIRLNEFRSRLPYRDGQYDVRVSSSSSSAASELHAELPYRSPLADWP